MIAVLALVMAALVVIAFGLLVALVRRDRDNADLREANADAAMTIEALRENLDQAGDALVFWAGWHDEAIADTHTRLQGEHLTVEDICGEGT